MSEYQEVFFKKLSNLYLILEAERARENQHECFRQLGCTEAKAKSTELNPDLHTGGRNPVL